MVNSSNHKPLHSYFKLFCLELSGKAVASNKDQHAGITAGSKVRMAKSRPEAFPCPCIHIPDRTTTHPSLQMPLLPQTHQLENCMDTPETDQISLHFGPEKKTHLNALSCNRKDCYMFSCSHLHLFSTPSQNQACTDIQCTEQRSLSILQIPLRLRKR